MNASSPDRHKIWDDILAHLRRFHPAQCRQWFEEIEVIDISSGTLKVAVPQQLQRRYLQRECADMFVEAAQNVTGRLVSVEFLEFGANNGKPLTPPAPTSQNGISTRGDSALHPNTFADNAPLDVDHSMRDREFQSQNTNPDTSQDQSAAANYEQRDPAPSPRPITSDFASNHQVAFIEVKEQNKLAPPQKTNRANDPVFDTSAANPQSGEPLPRVNGNVGFQPHQGKTLQPPLNEPLSARANGRNTWTSFNDEMVINPDYSFDKFVVGPNNHFAHAAAVAVSRQPGYAYNPFFIHGGVGLGKTHLLQAVCQAIITEKPDVVIYYVSCEGFVSQFMEAVQAGQMLEFRHRFRHVDVLVVDDIHFLAAHDRTQEEFFHTFNSLYQARKQIVLSSDAAPHEIPKLEDRLLSRFKSGLVARMDKPCYETRLAILKIKSQIRGLMLPDDVLCYIAHHTDSNIRELEGALTQIQALAATSNRPMDLELAREAVGESPTGAVPLVSIQSIITIVCKHFEIKQTELFSKKRHKSITLPRQVAMYLGRCHTNHSLQEIGSFFGGRDHTTVMHAVEKISKLRADDMAMSKSLDAIERDLSIRTP